MRTYNVTTARNQIYNILNEVNENHEPIKITGKNGNAVIIADSDWRAIEETIYLNAVPGLTKDLIDSLEEDIHEMKNIDEKW